MFDLCKVFGVEEGEEFKFKDAPYKFKIMRNKLLVHFGAASRWMTCNYELNYFTDKKVIKLPKKKAFTSDELAIMRSLPKEYKWIARDDYGSDDEIYTFSRKPKKEHAVWENNGSIIGLRMFKHLFPNIQWEDEEPVFIDDYVERGAK